MNLFVSQTNISKNENLLTTYSLIPKPGLPKVDNVDPLEIILTIKDNSYEKGQKSKQVIAYYKVQYLIKENIFCQMGDYKNKFVKICPIPKC